MADQLLDLRNVPGLAVPRDSDAPDDPAVWVLPKDDREEWVAQVCPSSVALNRPESVQKHFSVFACAALLRAIDCRSSGQWTQSQPWVTQLTLRQRTSLALRAVRKLRSEHSCLSCSLVCP